MAGHGRQPVAAGVDGRGLASRNMAKLTIGVVVVVVLAALGGVIFLALWSPPAPTVPVEKVVPNARFPK